jgi:diacylglycerol kinase (ATP)
MKWVAIANPAAGRPRAVHRAIGALATLDGRVLRVLETVAPGDATRLAREATGVDGLIVIGGDGTVCEVLNGMDLGRHALAVIPAGHGNCLARDLGTGTVPAAIDAVRSERLQAIDLLEAQVTFRDGRRQRRICASTVAAGYVTQVVTTGRRQLAWLGGAAYATAAMVTIPKRLTLHAELDSQGRRRTGIVINNTAHLANFRGLPDATLQDGKLDVMELDAGWWRQLLHNLSVLAGRRRHGSAQLLQSRSVSVTFDEPCTIMADGELWPGVRRLEVHCRPSAVRCAVAADP